MLFAARAVPHLQEIAVSQRSQTGLRREVGMRSSISKHVLFFSLVAGSLLSVTCPAAAQTVTVDAAPSHVANTFSPPHALGAAIDRLRTGTPEHLLTDPLLHEILGAGWGTVTYRQNT
jgi:hypothetical protein